MKAEEKLVTFIHDTRFADIPPAALKTVKHQVLAVIGTTIAGATADGCSTAVQLYRELGGKQEATILVHGGKIPAHDAASSTGSWLGRSISVTRWHRVLTRAQQ